MGESPRSSLVSGGDSHKGFYKFLVCLCLFCEKSFEEDLGFLKFQYRSAAQATEVKGESCREEEKRRKDVAK